MAHGSALSKGNSSATRLPATISATGGGLCFLGMAIVWHNYLRLDSGMPPMGLLQPERGYPPSLCVGFIGGSGFAIGYGIRLLIGGFRASTRWYYMASAAVGILFGLASLWMYHQVSSLTPRLSLRWLDQLEMKSLGESSHMYAKDHGGFFPSDMQTLIATNLALPYEVRCPAHQNTRQICRQYIPGQGVNDDHRNVLIYSEDGTFGIGADVVFLDGHVEWIRPYTRVLELVEQTQARLAARASSSMPSGGQLGDRERVDPARLR